MNNLNSKKTNKTIPKTLLRQRPRLESNLLNLNHHEYQCEI